MLKYFPSTAFVFLIFLSLCPLLISLPNFLFFCWPSSCLPAYGLVWFHMWVCLPSWYKNKLAFSFVLVCIPAWPLVSLNIHPCPSVSALVVWFAVHFLHLSAFLLICPPVCRLPVLAWLCNCLLVCRSVSLPVSHLVCLLYSDAADFTDPYTCQPNSSMVQFPLQQEGLWTDETWRRKRYKIQG